MPRKRKMNHVPVVGIFVNVFGELREYGYYHRNKYAYKKCTNPKCYFDTKNRTKTRCPQCQAWLR